MSRLEGLPDLIRDRIQRDGVEVSETAADIPKSFGSTHSLLRKAYIDGDYITIQKYTDIASNDLNPIYEKIYKTPRSAFFKVVNPSNQTPYWLAIAGPLNKPHGYMWSYTPPVVVKDPNGNAILNRNGEPQVNRVAQFGTYSANSNTLGISNQVLANSVAQLPAETIATAAATVVSFFIKNRITGMAAAAASEAAVAEAGGVLVAEGAVTTEIWVTIGATLAGAAIGLIVGAVAYFLVMFAVNFIYKAYKVAVNVYNWDPMNTYVIDAWCGDNAVIDDGHAFTPIALPPPTADIILPDGMKVTNAETIYQFATVVFDNDQKLLEGLGVAMSVRSKNSGFYIKYDCPRFSDNRIGITGGFGQLLPNYYKDSTTWAPTGSYSASSTIPDSGTPIFCTTTALGGRSDQFYVFDVHIGLKPTDKLNKWRATPPPKPLLQMLESRTAPGGGDVVTMPVGSNHVVLGESRNMTKSVATTEFGDDTYIFYYADGQLYYAKIPTGSDTKSCKGELITYSPASCPGSSGGSGSGSDSDSDSGSQSDSDQTVSVNDVGINPLAAATWYTDGNIHLFYTRTADAGLIIAELIYDGSSWFEGELKCSKLGIATYSTLTALPGSSTKGDYPRVYYTASKTDKLNEAYYKSDQWFNVELVITQA
ncbi:hypothetical protein F4802DRAFT_591628 [Xylaria palmicola]|nr:hypothetical protein F4802DRAFT_591628 [Xylaria palmicola]